MSYPNYKTSTSCGISHVLLECVTCTKYEYLKTEHECEACKLGTKPSADLKRCIPIPEEYLSYDSGIAIVAMTVAGSGFLVTVYVIHVFIKFRETPVVKASGRELSFVLLIGILVCYGMTFVIIAPTNFTCAAQKFGIGFCFSICYAALLTKTNRIARIFRAGKRTIRETKIHQPSVTAHHMFQFSWSTGAYRCFMVVIESPGGGTLPPNSGG